MLQLDRKYPVPRQDVRESSRDKHDFSGDYCRAVIKRIKALRHNVPHPKGVMHFDFGGRIFIDVQQPDFR
jgi:hypothetical protein